METIHVARGGNKLGEFTESEVREGLLSGRFLPTDLGWHAGLAGWASLSQIGGLTAAPPLPEMAPTPPPLADDATTTATGPAWEQRDTMGWADALVETLRSVLLEPTATFSNMRKVGDLQSPILFYVIMSCATGFISLLYQMIIKGWSGNYFAGVQIPFTTEFIIVPFIGFAFTFISAGITHLCLILIGGARRPFETTLRVFSYTLGSISALQIIPVWGGLIAALFLVALIWICVALPIGIAQGQETTMGKALIALTLPSLACFGLVILVVAILLYAGYSVQSGWSGVS